MALVWMCIASATALQGPTSGQDADCPRISVSCGEARPDETIPITFSAGVTGGRPIREVSYCWTVSGGTIKRGQGTAVIEVEARGRDRQGLTAAVNIGGFDPKCAHAASCSTPIP
jgi:hypothetical protein